MEGGDPELERALQGLRAEHRARQEELAEAVEQTERSSRSLADVALEFLYRGDTVRVAVGGQGWVGTVLHAGATVMTLATASGAEIDVGYDRLTAIRVVRRARVGGRTNASRHPGSILARLRELENTGETVEIGGAALMPAIFGSVVATARTHIEVRAADGGEWVIPLAEIGYLVRNRTESAG